MDYQSIWNAALTVGLFVISGFAGLGKLYLDRMHSSIRERMDEQDKLLRNWQTDIRSDICELETRLQTAREENGKLQLLVHRDFVSREEYIRTTQSLDAKIDRVLEEVGTINANVARLAALQEVKK